MVPKLVGFVKLHPLTSPSKRLQSLKILLADPLESVPV